MKVLFISGELIGSAVVHQLIKEGHDVKLYIDHEDRQDCFDGIVERVESWEDELDWVGKDGLIVFDDVTFAGEQDRLREAGYSVFGGDSKSDKLEIDRLHFHDVLEAHGIKTLRAYNFETADEAERFIREQNGSKKWVLKQSSHIGMLNYVGQRQDGQDVFDMLKIYREKNISPVHIQQRAEGIEIGVGRYFNGNDWVGPIEVNLEHKPLCNGDIGPLTAEMGTVIWYENDETLPLYQETLAKLKPYLQEINYKGDIDIDCIVNAEGVWPLEATMRFGTPSTELQCELHESPWGDFMKAIADGQPYDLQYKTDYGIVVSVVIPPFPFAPEIFGDSNIETCQGVSVFFKDNFSKEDMEHVHFEEVSRTVSDDGQERYYLSGKHGYALYATGHGETVEEAQQKAYDIIKKIIIPEMFYRTDIGDKFVREDRQQLKDWGWIK
ncbi:MAG: hypothetical protein KC877_05180 [Candidatus Kaiserbacteria bacterium]|nr:hypothetical protein [Candidatus Kaiserbacteria bacterium]MCB9816043.1 hypothetical protein [Candidatus Nomurabacteria bacterium]